MLVIGLNPEMCAALGCTARKIGALSIAGTLVPGVKVGDNRASAGHDVSVVGTHSLEIMSACQLVEAGGT